ncbi:hypothetical protein [Enterovibrio norvegicus]|uniref:hypothetical protein n=1 Tax=Enterovibrio norvegicus TaxID=188144 RepID=UPI00352C1210
MVEVFFNLGLVCTVLLVCRYTIFRLGGMPMLAISGPVGVVTHELSHYLMCKIMGFKVAEVVLFRIPSANDNTCGYVNYYRPVHSLTAPVRAMLVSIAPIFGGGIMIIVVTQVLLGNELSGIMSYLLKGKLESARVISISEYHMFYQAVWKHVIDKKDAWEIALWIYLCASIAIHALPSKPDIEQARLGSLYVTIALACLITYGFLWVVSWMAPTIIKSIATITYGLVVGLIPVILIIGMVVLYKIILKISLHRAANAES